MTVTENTVRVLFDAMNTRDLALLSRHLAPDATFDFPGTGTITGAKRILVFLKVLFRKYPRLVFNIRETLFDGDRACVIWENEGHTASGRLYNNRGVTLVHVSGQELVLISDYFKDTSFIQES